MEIPGQISAEIDILRLYGRRGRILGLSRTHCH
jgi:hypothetical protein